MLNNQSITSPHNEPHRSPGLFRGVLKKMVFLNISLISQENTCLESLFNNVQTCNFIKKILQHWCFPMKFAEFLRTSSLKNICKRLLLLDSPQNIITNSGGKFGLDETKLKEIYLTFQLTFLLNFWLCTLLKF